MTVVTDVTVVTDTSVEGVEVDTSDQADDSDTSTPSVASAPTGPAHTAGSVGAAAAAEVVEVEALLAALDDDVVRRHLIVAIREHTKRMRSNCLALPSGFGVVSRYVSCSPHSRQEASKVTNPVAARDNRDMNTPRLLSRHDVAQRLSVSLSTVDRLTRRGVLDSIHIGRRTLFVADQPTLSASALVQEAK